MLRALATLFALVLGVSCAAPGPQAEVVVQIHSTIGTKVDRIELFAQLGGGERDLSFPVDATTTFPKTHGITFNGGAALGPLFVTAVGFRGPVAVIEQTWETNFIPDASVVLPVELTEECIGVVCTGDVDGDRTCTPRGCVPNDANGALLMQLSSVLPATEICNDMDEDGDGNIDEGFAVYIGENHCMGCFQGCATGLCNAGFCSDAPLLDFNLGSFHTCARRVDGTVTCWGDASAGQTGDFLFEEALFDSEGDYLAYWFARGQPRPVFVPPEVGQTVQLEAGGTQTCLVNVEGKLFCLGLNIHGQLGRSTSEQVLWYFEEVTSLAGPEGATVMEVAAGFHHTCARMSTGRVKCFGMNEGGQSGGEALVMAQPIPVEIELPGAATAIGLGTEHSCAVVAGGAVYCWGLGAYGQLGVQGASGPTPVQALAGGAIDVTGGDRHTCALMQDGTVQCWGDNAAGQLGYPGPSSPTARPVPGVSGVEILSAASYVPSEGDAYTGAGTHTCAKTSLGSVICWGSNELGQLGQDPNQASLGPTVLVESGAIHVSTGNSVTCVLFDTGEMRCHGDNETGMLGDWSLDFERIVPEGVTVVSP